MRNITRKINIGAGTTWYKEGWEVLDNAPGNFNETWKHKGKAWESGLPPDTYDIVFTSHMLEHIPHFRAEQTFAEINRVMKIGGTFRISVPDLKKAAVAYVNGDKAYFQSMGHYSDHLGIGGSFVDVLISPGSQTLAVSREMDEVIGGYAHTTSYDSSMLRILLEKWGFGDVKESAYCASDIAEMRDPMQVYCDGEMYPWDHEFVTSNKYKSTSKIWHFTDFDNQSPYSVYVEAKKVRDEPYAFEKEFDYNKRGRRVDPVERLKLKLLKYSAHTVDWSYRTAKFLGLTRVFRIVYRSLRSS